MLRVLVIAGKRRSQLLIENGQTVKDEKELTNIHNTHFKDKIEKIEREIPKTDESPTRRLKESLEGRGLKFGLREVSEKQIEKAIKSLKNKSSSGTDFVSPKVIKMTPFRTLIDEKKKYTVIS